MDCTLAGVVGIGMVSAAYSCMTVSPQQQCMLQKTLSPDLADKYQAIVKERRDLYLQGLGIGAVAAYFSSRALCTGNTFHRAMVFLSVTLIVAIVYYQAMPKSSYMLRHLNTPEQNKAWLDVYLTMKGRHISGFLLGALAAVPISLALCND